MIPRIGFVTIGQAPRDDVSEDFLAAVGRDVVLLQCGALDDLSGAEIAALAPQTGDYVLVTRLRDGTQVKVAEHLIHDRMKQAIRFLEASGASPIVLLCTGEFPDLDSTRLILRPDVLLHQVAGVLIGAGRLGVLVPSSEQIPAMMIKWKGVGCCCECIAVSPYTASLAELKAAALDLAARKVDLIVLDCIGYTQEMKNIMSASMDIPVILPRTFLARLTGELLTGFGD